MKPKYAMGSGVGFTDIHPPSTQIEREAWIVDMSKRRAALAEALDYVGLLALAQDYDDHAMPATANGVRKQAGKVAQMVLEKALDVIPDIEGE